VSSRAFTEGSYRARGVVQKQLPSRSRRIRTGTASEPPSKSKRSFGFGDPCGGTDAACFENAIPRSAFHSVQCFDLSLTRTVPSETRQFRPRLPPSLEKSRLTTLQYAALIRSSGRSRTIAVRALATGREIAFGEVLERAGGAAPDLLMGGGLPVNSLHRSSLKRREGDRLSVTDADDSVGDAFGYCRGRTLAIGT
jgi:hypothetical protein